MIEIPWSDKEFMLKEIDLVQRNSENCYIDGDRKTLVIEYPNELLLSLLDERGISTHGSNVDD